MTNYREILRMFSNGFSQRKIAEVLKLSRNTVSSVVHKAQEQALSWERILSGQLTDSQIAECLYPKQCIKKAYQQPDYAYIEKELRKTGVSLQMLWLEYCGTCHDKKQRPYMYSRYCDGYRTHIKKSKATMHIPRTPGEQVEVDWAGPTAYLKDPATGESVPVHIFVAAMSYSQYCYAEGFLNMKQDAWIQAHIHLFTFLGGVPKTIVPDNLKTGVSKASKTEPQIQKNYQEMAEHYHTFILPARVAKPRDKGNVESMVGKFANNLLGKIRNRAFFTLEEFNNCLHEHLEQFNSHQFQKKLGSRAALFAEEQALLTPLPQAQYEMSHWKTATVQPNYHIAADGMFYSVPYQYISQKLDVKLSSTSVAIYKADQRIASHKRLYGRTGQYATCKEHMPAAHQTYLEWDEKRFMRWAKQIGPATEEVIRLMLGRYEIPQHSFRGCMALLKLSGNQCETRLESACTRALAFASTLGESIAPSYKTIKHIFKQELSEKEPTGVVHEEDDAHAFIRNLRKGGKNE